MDSQDRDFKLSHEQLIMCVKILLHLVNNTNTRITQEKEWLMEDFKKEFKMVDGMMRS